MGARNAPHFAIELGELAARGQAGQLFKEESPLAAAAEAEFSHQLLESGFRAGRAGDARNQFAIGHASRVQGATVVEGYRDLSSPALAERERAPIMLLRRRTCPS